MGVYIKGMRMPKDCRECRLKEYSFTTGTTWCGVNGAVLAMNFGPIKFDGRPEWCPLVDLGRHGRLIDENEVRTVMTWLLTQPQRPTWIDTCHAIQEMNAVIEAEDGE